ncbi:hypothetical protein TRVL_08457 [Trypanosoma vivax]|uniref:Uncharacterized protein n=1 Tax=Trypanosoma vivax (strain Y486) TaxID=1055687 RepID=G0U8I6_TRYVY|nr:hypothetical protein TRVL_08457 [Trypanosoma vivax]CCC53912.1 conserved hypothetical protein [Trypanosoma vivax Y486]
MSFEEADRLLQGCSLDVLHVSISKVFRRLLANILLQPKDSRYHVVRKNNIHIRSALNGLSSEAENCLFNLIGFKLELNQDSEEVYVFHGDIETLSTSDKFLSYLEERIDCMKLSQSGIQQVPLLSRGSQKLNARRESVIQKFGCTAKRQEEKVSNSVDTSTQSVFCDEDFSSVDHLKEKARLTLLNTGRVRNSLFNGRHFSLRRMKHGRVYVCKEDCGVDFLEAHWHLFSSRNLLYSYIAHLTPDASAMVHMGVEHGYQYNSLPGTENFRKTIHFSAKRLNSASGQLEYIEHPNKPSETCVYCGVTFTELFL